MKIVIKVEDGDDKSEVEVDISQWRVMPLEIRLVAAAMEQPLARACLGWITIGLDTLMQEYGRIQAGKRKKEFRDHIGVV